MIEGVCGTCQFYSSESLCKRFPPQFTGVQQITTGVFENYEETTEDLVTWGYPSVEVGDWCGEHREV